MRTGAPKFTIRQMNNVNRRKPNVLLIGAPRCASTSLVVALSQHPDIFVCSPKEPHFLAMHGYEAEIAGIGKEAFAKENRFTHDQWLDLFRGRTEKRLVDASVSTISYPKIAIGNIRRYCEKDAKMIAILRNPVNRAFSSYQYCRSRGWAAGAFEECLDQEQLRIEQNWQHLWFLKTLSQYERRLRPFLDAFGPDSVHIAITEEFAKDPAFVLSGIFDFLDLPVLEINASRRYNSSGVPKSPIVSELSAFARRRPALLKTLAAISPMSFREQVKSRSLARTAMAEDTRAWLSRELAETRPWVERLIGRRLEGWN